MGKFASVMDGSLPPVTVRMSALYADEEFADGLVVDLQGLEGTNAYCSDDAAAAVRRALWDIPAGGLHWIDTGDYHYLSLMFLEKVREPFALVLLDNHPDDQAPAFDPECLSCGSWVDAARRSCPLMACDFWIRSADDAPEIPEGLPVYVSLDLDVLSTAFVRTNWDQGEMSFLQLSDVLRRVCGGRRVIGADVCGGLTAAKGALSCDLARNRALRLAVRELLGEFLPGLTDSPSTTASSCCEGAGWCLPAR